jgi:short-subunit dehydrogenase
LKDTGVTVSCLMPGATDTEFFRRADLMAPRSDRQRRMIRPRSPRSALTP